MESFYPIYSVDNKETMLYNVLTVLFDFFGGVSRWQLRRCFHNYLSGAVPLSWAYCAFFVFKQHRKLIER